MKGERAHRARDLGGVGSYPVVVGEREPADDLASIDDDGRRQRDVPTVGTAAGVDETVAPRHRQVAIGEEAIAGAQALGERLAPLFGVGTCSRRSSSRPG